MSVESIWAAGAAPQRPKWRFSGGPTSELVQFPCIRASQPMEDKNKFYKELGMFSLRKKIEDAVTRAEMMASNALEVEAIRQMKQEEMVRKYNLWDDLVKSDEILSSLANSSKVVDALKDLKYKAEEAKLITQLAEKDVINYQLFKQAYKASVDLGKFLDHYEMCKLLSGPYDMEGACVIVRAGSDDVDAELWAERLLNMYKKWGEKHGLLGRVIEMCPSKHGGLRSATIEFESRFIYGLLSGEKGTHEMVQDSLNETIHQTSCLAGVDVIPLFLETAPNVPMAEQDLQLSLVPTSEELKAESVPAVRISHIPTGITVQCSGERNQFANKIKALNRLKAKLLVVAAEQGFSDTNQLSKNAIPDIFCLETRKYVLHPYKLVHDVRTGIQLADLASVLEGDLEPLVGAHISIRNPRGFS